MGMQDPDGNHKLYSCKAKRLPVSKASKDCVSCRLVLQRLRAVFQTGSLQDTPRHVFNKFEKVILVASETS